MRKILLFSILLTLFTLPFTLPAQSTKVSLNLKGATVNDVLNEIESKSDYTFLVNQKLVDLNRKVDAVYTNTAISEILAQLFKNDQISVVVSDKQIILSPAKADVKANQTRKVTGTVTDSRSNEPLPGVTVLVKGTTSGTVTNIDGKYSVDVSSPLAILVFSYIGYTTQEIVVGDNSLINITLVETSKELEGVVVTALGIKREEKALGYAVQKVEGKALQTIKVVDVTTSLTGKVAGLSVYNNTDFGEEAGISLRGETPILVIDGVPFANMSLRDVPPDDIENISILKGATASALYGARGRGGAIMITTKKGSEKKGVSVAFNSGSLFAAGHLAIPESQSTYGREVNTGTNTAVTNGDGAWGPPLEGQEVIQWDPIIMDWVPMPYIAKGANNFKNFLEQAYILNNNLSFAQQGEYGSIRASASWVKTKGQYPNTTFDKYTYSLGGDIKINKLTFTSGLTYNKHYSPNKGFNGYTSYDPMYSLLIWSSPDWNVLDYKNYWMIPDEQQNTSYTDTNNNPYFEMNERTHSIDKDIFNGSFSIMYDVFSWLKATLRSGFDTYSNRQIVKIAKSSLVSAGSATVIENGDQVWGESRLGSYNIGLGRGYSLNNDFILSGNKTFNKIIIDGFAGGSIYYSQDEGTDSRTLGGLSIPGFYSLDASKLNPYVKSSYVRQQLNSLFGRLSLSWKSMVYAEGTMRNDWSSTLSSTTRSYLYPSVAGSFVASELLPDLKWLSLWKLRGSWTVSKKPADVYAINQVYYLTNNIWGNITGASVPSGIYNSTIFPETAETWEIGTAINLYNNRISADIAYYNKIDYDFIEEAEVSPSSGYNYSFVNTNEKITRKGVEVTLTGSPVKTQDWEWNILVNWTKYGSYWTAIDTNFTKDSPWNKVGERADAYVLRNFLYDPEGNIIHSNGLPQYSEYYSKYGNYDPDWIWGLNTSLKHKNWSFAISFDGRVGGMAQTTTEMYMWRSGSHPESVTPERYLDATNPGSKNYVGDGVKVVSGSATYDTYGNIVTDDRVYAPNDVAVTYKSYIEAAHSGTAWGGTPSPLEAYVTTFFKIRDIAVTYELPKDWCSKIKSQGITVSAIGQNVFLWAKQFKYSDPDGGYENFSDPSIRYIGFNLKLNY